MSTQLQFDIVANNYANRYKTYLENILGSYNRAILNPRLNLKSFSNFRTEVTDINRQYVEREVDYTLAAKETLVSLVTDATKDFHVNALQDREWEAYLADNTNFLFEAIKLQSFKDNLYINNFLRAKIIQISNLTDYEKAHDLVFNHKQANFFYTDKIGRKLNSIKYVRAIARDYMVKNYNDLIAGTAILNDVDNLTIESLDVKHKDHGKLVSIKTQDDVNYFAIRDTTFHPNTNSIVKIG